jgi:DNA-binding NarL/FixJ family response regulator
MIEGRPADDRHPGERSCNVVVLDDHEIVRDSLRCILESVPSVRTVTCVASGGELFELPDGSYDAVVVDLVLPDMPGTMVLRRLAGQDREVILVAITGHADAAALRRARDAGAITCLSKASSAYELRVCLEAALGGAVVLDSGSRMALANGSVHPKRTALSRREREVLDLIVEGLTARQIGEHLVISEATVRAHRHRIYQKLGVGSRREAAELLNRDAVTDYRGQDAISP